MAGGELLINHKLSATGRNYLVGGGKKGVYQTGRATPAICARLGDEPASSGDRAGAQGIPGILLYLRWPNE